MTTIGLDGVAAYYRQRWGWPAFAKDSIVWMAPGYAADAVNLPRDLGRLACARLLAARVRLPVIEIPSPPARWVLLAAPHPGPAEPIEALLAGHDIGYAHGRHSPRANTTWSLDLPPTRHPGHAPLVWIIPPAERLPELVAVVDAVARVVTGRAGG